MKYGEIQMKQTNPVSTKESHESINKTPHQNPTNPLYLKAAVLNVCLPSESNFMNSVEACWYGAPEGTWRGKKSKVYKKKKKTFIHYVSVLPGQFGNMETSTTMERSQLVNYSKRIKRK